MEYQTLQELVDAITLKRHEMDDLLDHVIGRISRLERELGKLQKLDQMLAESGWRARYGE